MATVRVTIFRRGNSCHVFPPRQKASRNDTVEIKAQNTPAVLYFTDNTVFGSSDEVVDIASGGTAILTVQTNAPYGVHPYAVYCEDINDFALGTSPPYMIIE